MRMPLANERGWSSGPARCDGCKSEIRNPKSERSPKSEIRRERGVRFRISGFGFLSDFGFRISDFSRSIRLPHPSRSHRPTASVLIIVLWVAFGLVSLALYFAHTMTFELRAADNRVASIEAEQAIAGAARYVSNILATVETPGMVPDIQNYESDAVPLRENDPATPRFWLIGRDPQGSSEQVYFGLVDEASKLNLNTASSNLLEWLPGMTPELAAAILDWRDSDSDVSDGGAEDEIYQRLVPAYRCKNAPFESIEELRLVYGMDLLTMYGEDMNLNGTLDANENDGEVFVPEDNRDGRLDPGLLEYLTVYSKEPNTRTNGEARVFLTSTNESQLTTVFTEIFGSDRAASILQTAGLVSSGGGGGGAGGGGGSGGGGGGGGGGAQTNTVAVTFTNLLEFYLKSGMTATEWAQIEGDLTTTSSNSIPGLVNVNTASETVLACIPGIGAELAPLLVTHRQSNSGDLTSLAWIVDVLGATNALQAAPYLTSRSYQFSADIAALGHHGRGYQRVKFIFDTSEGAPRIVHRQDLTRLGWALGEDAREDLKLEQEQKR